jgi:hypothetical protein
MKKIIAVIAIFCISSVAHAKQEIVGAFGVRLGGTVDESMEFVGENGLGELIYKFTPAKPNEYFSSYEVYATHESKKIFEIHAWHGYDDKAVCSTKLQILHAALSNKYGSAFPNRPHRNIFAYCETKVLRIAYSDNALEEQSKIEKAKPLSDSL